MTEHRPQLEADTPAVAIQAVQGCLIVPVQIELYEPTLERLRRDLLEAIRETGLLRVVVDLRGVTLLDRFAFDHLRDTLRMASIMGAETLYAGIGAGVASCLVDLDPTLSVRVAAAGERNASTAGAGPGGIRVAASVQEALRCFAAQPTPKPAARRADKTTAATQRKAAGGRPLRVTVKPRPRIQKPQGRNAPIRDPQIRDSGHDPVAALLAGPA